MVFVTYLTLIFGELVPKRIAMQKPMQVARMACGVVSAVAFIMKPVVWFLSFSTNLILRLLRMKVEAEEESVTAEEIRLMVDLGEEKGTIDKEEGEWIDNVFDFGDSWWFEIKVLKLLEERVEQPEIIRSEKAAPKQYPDWEE